MNSASKVLQIFLENHQSIYTFLTIQTIYREKKDMKREYRELSDETKQKISQNPVLHQPRRQETKDKISQGMQKYWHTVPNKPKSGTDMIANGEIV